MTKFKLEIKTPEEVIYSGDIESLVVPHPEGLEGYLANHEPTLSELVPGKLSYLEADQTESRELEITGGWLVFSDNQAVIFLR